ncbi:MAG: cytosolic protein [gamma proteobacterium symbiont of Ctena orbiculata]|nr:MAG: cytosolic protein [gamma proteobacterium symbiont of Ctena orbiculata]
MDRSTPAPEKTHPRIISPGEFTLGSYRFTLRLTKTVELPRYKGDVFHRVLGKGLEAISPRFGQYFFHPAPISNWPYPGQTPPKPFTLIPPLSSETNFQAGETLDVGFTLFGPANQHLMTVFAALEKLGTTSGLNKGGGRFQIDRLIQITTEKPRELFAGAQWLESSQPTSAADIFAATPPTTDEITLYIHTRLRLKDQGALMRGQLPLVVLIDRLAGRVNTLAAMYCSGPMLPPEEKTALVTLARTAAMVRDDTRWSDWSRDSKDMKFGGLEGTITYQNVPGVLLPWLNLGQWIGVGGKTSFGLGLYSTELDTCTN